MAEPNNPYESEQSLWYGKEYQRWFQGNKSFMDGWMNDTIDTLDKLPQDLEALMGNSIPGLKREVQVQFNKMVEAAKAEGIMIHEYSGYRSYDYQRIKIWNRKFTNYTKGNRSPTVAIHRIIEYSTIPGTSRHHWGTEVDIIDSSKTVATKDKLKAEYFGEGKPYGNLKKWMDEKSKDFGFYLVYTDAPGRKGFKYEPWHYSYAPLSKIYYKQYNEKFAAIKKIIQADKSINGYKHLTDAFLDAYQSTHLMDINPELK